MDLDPDCLLDYSEKLYELVKTSKKKAAKITAMSYGKAAYAVAVVPTLSLALYLSDTPVIAAPPNLNFSTIHAATAVSSITGTASILSGSNIVITSSGDEGKLGDNLNFSIIAHSQIR